VSGSIAVTEACGAALVVELTALRLRRISTRRTA
jgi:hypothetical protein